MRTNCDDKTLALISFFAMVTLLSLLCIFIYFGGNEMDNKAKLCTILFIIVIAVAACCCILFSKPAKKNVCKIECSDVYILYKDKKFKTCRIQFFNSLGDMMNDKLSETKIFIVSDENLSE